MRGIIFTDVNAAPGWGRYGGTYRFASELRQHGHTIKVVDIFSELTIDNIESIFEGFEFDFIGFSTTLWVKNEPNLVDLWTKEKRPIRFVVADLNKSLFPHDDEFMQELRMLALIQNPNVKFVVGGAKASNKRFQRENPWIDHWVTGQGEESELFFQNKFEFNISQTQYDMSDLIFDGEHLPIEVARGCIFRCAFCAFDLNGKRPGDYIKKTEVLREELIRNYEQFGTTAYMISDDTLNDSPEKIEALHKMITSLPFDFEFSSYLRLDLIERYPQMIPLLREMGIRSCQFGIETLNHETGKVIGKGLHPDRQKEILHTIKSEWKDETYLGGGFIIGLPKETEETAKVWLDWLDTDDCPLDSTQVVPLFPVPGSKIGDDQDVWQYGKWIKEEDAHRIVSEWYEGGNRRKRNLTAFHFYSRMRNLGYTHKECGELYMDDKEKILDSEKRRVKLKEKYLNALL